MKPIVRSSEEIDKLLEVCFEQEVNCDSLFWAKTYEQGISAMFNWLTDEKAPYPLDED